MTRRRALGVARLLFVLLALASAWWGFRGRWGEIGAAVAGTGPARLAGAVACAAAGLVVTAGLWRLLLRWAGTDVGAREASSVFLVGQLGKYVPGSVWNVVAQAQLGRRHGVPARSSAAASLVFLLVHTASGLVVGAVLVLLGAVGLPAGTSPLWAWAALLVGAGALAPPLLRWLLGRLAGAGPRPAPGIGGVGAALVLMAVVWVSYGTSLLLLVPEPARPPGLPAATAVFALAHAIGVLVVVAPAGVGAREAVVVALLSPLLGPTDAVAAALLSRTAHALADFLVAAAAAGWERATHPGRVAPAGALR